MVSPCDSVLEFIGTLIWLSLLQETTTKRIAQSQITTCWREIQFEVVIVFFFLVFSAPSPEPSGAVGDVDMVDISQSPSGASWTCKHCTFINEHGHENCDMCGLPQTWVILPIAKKTEGQEIMTFFFRGTVFKRKLSSFTLKNCSLFLSLDSYIWILKLHQTCSACLIKLQLRW